MAKIKILPIANLIAYVAMVLVNTLFQISSNSTASISDLYPTLLTPSGITFSIWIVIYGLLLAYVIREIIKGDEYNLGLLFLMSCILNIMWIIVWSYKMLAISLAIIIALAIVLYQIKRKVENADTITKLAFSIYCAWITIASIVSIFVLITSLNNGVFNSGILRIASVISLATLIIFIYTNRNNVPYLSVFIWSLLGIIIKNVGFFNGRYKEIIVTCILMMIISIFMIFNFNSRKEGLI